jgi:hypothetical protein
VYASNHDQNQDNVTSQILRFDRASRTFVHYQYLPTHSAGKITPFVIEGELYLAAANHYNGSGGSIVQSQLFKVNASNQFEEFQTFTSFMAMDMEVFSIGSDVFLAISNFYNFVTHNLHVDIYKRNAETGSVYRILHCGEYEL